MRDVEIGQREAEFSAFMESIHHLSDEGIREAEAPGCHLHFSLFQERADYGRRDVDATYLEGFVPDYLDAHLLAIAHVIFESLLAVVTEAMVVADEEFPYVEMVVEHLLHKLSCRHGSHRLVEMQHHKDYPLPSSKAAAAWNQAYSASLADNLPAIPCGDAHQR